MAKRKAPSGDAEEDVSDIKTECERLAKLAWPEEDRITCGISDDGKYAVIFGERSLLERMSTDDDGECVGAPEYAHIAQRGGAPQALLAMLRALANEPDPRLAKVEALVERFRACARGSRSISEGGYDLGAAESAEQCADELELILKGTP